CRTSELTLAELGDADGSDAALSGGILPCAGLPGHRYRLTRADFRREGDCEVASPILLFLGEKRLRPLQTGATQPTTRAAARPGPFSSSRARAQLSGGHHKSNERKSESRDGGRRVPFRRGAAALLNTINC